MRIAHLFRASLVPTLALAAACSGKAAPTGPTAPATTDRAPGTTGFPGLDWGANADDIKALYPAVEANDSGLAIQTDVEGAIAGVQFVMDGDGLQQIDIGWAKVFDSMEACGDDLHVTRGAIDARLGHGAEENLGVFWETPTASVALVCDPGDDGTALMQARYTRKAPGES